MSGVFGWLVRGLSGLIDGETDRQTGREAGEMGKVILVTGASRGKSVE